MKIESNMNDVLLRLNTNLQNIPIVTTEKALRISGLDAVALVQNRVQHRGESLSGKMRTKAQKTFGSYSKGWGGYRNSKGFQTGIIDWTLDGDLWRSWKLLYSDNKVAEIGFDNETQGDKASYLEDYFGDTIGLTTEERNLVIESFTEEVNKDIKQWV